MFMVADRSPTLNMLWPMISSVVSSISSWKFTGALPLVRRFHRSIMALPLAVMVSASLATDCLWKNGFISLRCLAHRSPVLISRPLPSTMGRPTLVVMVEYFTNLSRCSISTCSAISALNTACAVLWPRRSRAI